MTMDQRAWIDAALGKLVAESNRTPDTPLRVFPLPPEWGIDLYLKDETVFPTGSLKHRLAQSLLIYALVNGDLDASSTLVEASSGSTAVSEAYFASLLGLKFVAVVPAKTSPAKIALIENYGGRCELVDPKTIYAEAERLGAQPGWHYLDQFTNASIATDWRSKTNLPGSIFTQLRRERFPMPEWIVVGAGTGGTSATIGRYCRYFQTGTRVAVVDPEGSVFHRAWLEGRRDVTDSGSRIEGIGRPRVEPSFLPNVLDEVMAVPDAASLAAMYLLRDVTGVQAGASTGTNLYGALQKAAAMRDAGEQGSIVTLICDRGDRYAESYYSEAWIRGQGLDLAPHRARLETFLQSGTWAEDSRSAELIAQGA